MNTVTHNRSSSSSLMDDLSVSTNRNTRELTQLIQRCPSTDFIMENAYFNYKQFNLSILHPKQNHDLIYYLEQSILMQFTPYRDCLFLFLHLQVEFETEILDDN